MPSTDALATAHGTRPSRQASDQHYQSRDIDSNESVHDLLDKFPSVPQNTPALRRTVSMGGAAAITAHTDHKKSFSDPLDTKRSRKKSFGQTLRGLFGKEPRKSTTYDGLSVPPTLIPSRSEETKRLRTWTLSGKSGLSPKKQSPPPPLPSRASWDDESTLNDPQTPLDSGVLADHEHLSPVNWGRGKTVSITADGLTRKASILRLDVDTVLLRVEPGRRSQYRVEGLPACRRCDCIYGPEGTPVCGCGDFSESDDEHSGAFVDNNRP